MSKFDDRVREAMRSDLRELWLAFQDRDEAQIPDSDNRDELLMSADIKDEMLNFFHDEEVRRRKIPTKKADEDDEQDDSNDEPTEDDNPFQQAKEKAKEAGQFVIKGLYDTIFDTVMDIVNGEGIPDSLKKAGSELNRFITNLELHGLKKAAYVNDALQGLSALGNVLQWVELSNMARDFQIQKRQQHEIDAYVKQLTDAVKQAQSCCSAQTQLLENVVIPEIEDIDPGKSNGLVRNTTNQIINEIRRSASQA